MLYKAGKPGRHYSGSLEVYLLGVVDFDSALALQERLARELYARDDTQGKLLLCEHQPIITVGREGSAADIRADETDLISREMEIRWLNRGGGCIVHAPGQLAAYPVVPLDRLGLRLDGYRRRLEQAVIDTCSEMRVPAYRDVDRPGVWCRTGKFTELGVSVRSWVAYHGLFINVAPSVELLNLVGPQSTKGPGRETTTLVTERHGNVSMHVVREGLLRHLARQLAYDEYHLYTGHPLLKRTRRRVHVHA